MTILYLWLEKYNTFENLNVNFGGRYIFNFNQIENKLEMKENPHYIDKFFDIVELNSNSEISLLTGIVGSNGTGKTTLIEVLRNIFTEKYEDLNFKFILVTKNDGKVKVLSNLENNLSIPTIGIRVEKNHSEKKSIIFISTIFDRKIEKSRDNEINLSTNYLLKNINMDSYESAKIRQDLAFLQFNNKHRLLDDVEFKLPEKLIVHILDTLSNEKIDKSLSLSDKIIDQKNRFIINIQYNFVNYALNIIDHWLEVEVLYKQDSRNVEKVRRLIDVKNEIKNYKSWDYLREQLNFYKQGKHNNINLLVNLMHFVDKIIDTTEHSKDFEVKIESDSSFSLSSNKEIFDFIQLYSKNVVGSRDFFGFQWRSLSTGEESLLDIFSRIFQSSKKTMSRKWSEEIIIFIDEVENNLHPHWQKQIVNHLLRIIKLLFKNKKIHLILTSHSPFIISDIPHTNIIMLERNGDISNVKENIEDLERTFAGNIHTLLAHSFFMKNGLMGTFSKEKINKVYSQIINSDRNELLLNRVILEKQINIISEPLIRNKLLSELENRLKLDIHDEILILKERLQNLENISYDKNK
ncbi:AAA family ATPase [Lysinibacillus xylanilyticus]|uniref:AAA family ATPase n=1 Tax=Lysinibacillus xylanilyticus TaxID=582475 RepID=UPI003CFC7146